MVADNSLSAEIDSANRRFLQRFAMSDIAGLGDCYTGDGVGSDWKIHRDMLNTSLPRPA